MVWFLPLIVIGGMYYPLLGYLAVAMIAFFLTLAFFKGRFWCWNLCPRGAFLDGVLSKTTLNRRVPKVFTRQWFRWSVFVLLMSLVVFRLWRSGGDLVIVGSVFVGMCILTTGISIILGVAVKQRVWCMICPMGTLQDKVGKIGLSYRKRRNK